MQPIQQALFWLLLSVNFIIFELFSLDQIEAGVVLVNYLIWGLNQPIWAYHSRFQLLNEDRPRLTKFIFESICAQLLYDISLQPLHHPVVKLAILLVENVELLRMITFAYFLNTLNENTIAFIKISLILLGQVRILNWSSVAEGQCLVIGHEVSVDILVVSHWIGIFEPESHVGWVIDAFLASHKLVAPEDGLNRLEDRRLALPIHAHLRPRPQFIYKT